jgi:predicted O-methyltransferase YrrM
MSHRTENVAEALAVYLRDISAARESDVLRRLRERTAPMAEARMQISVEMGRLMALLTRLTGARRALEVGTFTGYSALCIAEALPEDGTLVCCDVSEEWTSIGRAFWEEAGAAGRIDLRLAPALGTLVGLRAAGHEGTFDLAFVDADKEAYAAYAEHCLALLRPGGLVLFDNALWGGTVVAPEPDDEAANVLRALTERLFADERVDPALVPIGDGLLLARKR